MKQSECKTQSDVIKYMQSNLRKAGYEDPAKIWQLHSEFRQCCGFYSQIWYNNSTGRWAFNVSQDDDWDADSAPNFGTYDSYHALMSGVSAKYVDLWKLV